MIRTDKYLDPIDAAAALIVTLSVLVLTQSRGSWIGIVLCADLAIRAYR